MLDPPTKSSTSYSHDPPPSSSIVNSRRRQPLEPCTPTKLKNDPPQQHYHYMKAPPQVYHTPQKQSGYHDYYSPHRNGNNSSVAYTPSLRRRSSYLQEKLTPIHSAPSKYQQQHQQHSYIPTNEDDSRRRLNYNHSSPSKKSKLKKKKKSKSTLSSRDRLSRIIICLFCFWVIRGTIRMIFGSSSNNSDQNDYLYTSHMNNEEEEDDDGPNLRGSSQADIAIKDISTSPKDLNVHYIDKDYHEIEEKDMVDTQSSNGVAKENGKDIISIDVEKKEYMDPDSTNEFFFAGGINIKKRIVNWKGRIETISSPGHTYADIPYLLDSNPFAISIWINLSPLPADEHDAHRPRVILSTRSKGYLGCSSENFGDRPDTGIVLYAHPHYGDDKWDNLSIKTYRIKLEYAITRNRSCQTIVGSQTDEFAIVHEGEWNHIVIFATQTSRNERISMYINGNLAGRNDNAPREFLSHKTIESKTTVGRFATQSHSSNHFDLGGRVGMLSYWETGGPNTIADKETRMLVKTTDDEDQLVKAINRAAFDITAIKELSNRGLAVKEPTLFYPLEHIESKIIDELYTDDPPPILFDELMLGYRGRIITELKDGMPIYQREAFIPLGGNRYSEYKDRTFVPKKLKPSERNELDQVARARSGLVKKAMQHAWKGYKEHAFGKDELLPLSQGGQDNWGGMGTTLVDSLSTLWIMGMEIEFREARDWVRDHLDFSQVRGGVSVFETTIRNLGGLLSAYDLSGDKAFLQKADDLGTRLMKAFTSRSSLPFGEVELFDGGRAYNTGWHSNYAVLSEIGTLQVEFRYLARATGKSEYATTTMRAMDELLKLNAESGLYPTFISNTKQDISFGNEDISIGAMGDSFYEYLLKIWLQGGKKETKYRRRYDESMNGIMDKLIHMSRPNYLTYVAEMKRGKVEHKMDHLSCFLGGLLSLGAYTHPDGLQSLEAQRQLKTGKQLAYTCYQMYARSKSGLAPEFVNFDNAQNDFRNGHPYYILRPETAETFYILYQLTKDPVYREWSWEIFQAIEEHCKTEAGYASIKNVDQKNKQDNRMESFFLAETLKYLFLIQDDTNDIDIIHTHVFNTEAHPLRIFD